MENIITWVIAGAVFLLAGLILVRHFRKSSKGDCGCGCEGCSSSASCHSAPSSRES